MHRAGAVESAHWRNRRNDHFLWEDVAGEPADRSMGHLTTFLSGGKFARGGTNVAKHLLVRGYVDAHPGRRSSHTGARQPGRDRDGTLLPEDGGRGACLGQARVLGRLRGVRRPRAGLPPDQDPSSRNALGQSGQMAGAHVGLWRMGIPGQGQPCPAQSPRVRSFRLLGQGFQESNIRRARGGVGGRGQLRLS